METSSEYSFPIFISSTDYNLKDLRAELSRFLTELGYRPFLSSAEGFPDSSPILEPWESCLPVLDKCFVMILIIDGNYGTCLPWPNHKTLFGDSRISPTHGEYISAHRSKKRMLVFIRKSLMPHYQSYRIVMKRCKGDKEAAEKILSPTLPDYISFESLDFINEVKTTKPIPWITEFEDITSIKREIQKKMLNELAEMFLVKNKHLETVIDSFNKLMDSLSSEEQKNVLLKINATKEITEAINQIEEYKRDLDKTKEKLAKTEKSNTEEREKYEKKMRQLNNKIAQLEENTLNSSDSPFFIKNGEIKIGNPNYLDNFSGASFWAPIGQEGSLIPTGFSFFPKICNGCSKEESKKTKRYLFSNLDDSFKTCPSCGQFLCPDCWKKENRIVLRQYFGSSLLKEDFIDKCAACKK